MGISKRIPHQNQTLKLKWFLSFILDYESYFFCLFTSLILFFLFFQTSLYMHLRTGHISMNCLSCWLLICGKPHHLALIVYAFWSVFRNQRAMAHWWTITQFSTELRKQYVRILLSGHHYSVVLQTLIVFSRKIRTELQTRINSLL